MELFDLGHSSSTNAQQGALEVTTYSDIPTPSLPPLTEHTFTGLFQCFSSAKFKVIPPHRQFKKYTVASKKRQEQQCSHVGGQGSVSL